MSPDEPVTSDEEAAQAAGGDGTAAPESDAAVLSEELEQTKRQYLRALADYQNLQRRSQEERREYGRYQLTSLVLNFLPVLDDLERAIDAVSGEGGEAAWLEGVRLVHQKFKGVLEATGVEEIHALNQPFDPEKHEAVGSAPGPDGHVVHLVQRGYTLNDHVIRAAMVIVGSGESDQTEADGTDASDENGTVSA